MANDKTTMLKLKRMLQLLDAGRSMNQVCAELHMSKRTVHSYKERAEQSEIPVLRQMPEEQLKALLLPSLFSGREEHFRPILHVMSLFSGRQEQLPTKIRQKRETS